MSDTQLATILLIVFFGLLFLSHLAWYATDAVLCLPVHPVPFRCFLGSIAGFVLLLLAIPAGILHVILGFLFGIDNYGGVTFFLGMITAGLLIFHFRASLFDATTEAASYTVRQETPKPDLKATRKASERTKKETEQRKGQTDLEDAIRDLEAAKARMDELNKKENQS